MIASVVPEDLMSRAFAPGRFHTSWPAELIVRSVSSRLLYHVLAYRGYTTSWMLGFAEDYLLNGGPGREVGRELSQRSAGRHETVSE